MTLEELRPDATVRGLVHGWAVIIVSVHWFEADAVGFTYKGGGGVVSNELLFSEGMRRVAGT